MRLCSHCCVSFAVQENAALADQLDAIEQKIAKAEVERRLGSHNSLFVCLYQKFPLSACACRETLASRPGLPTQIVFQPGH